MFYEFSMYKDIILYLNNKEKSLKSLDYIANVCIEFSHFITKRKSQIMLNALFLPRIQTETKNNF